MSEETFEVAPDEGKREKERAKIIEGAPQGARTSEAPAIKPEEEGKLASLLVTLQERDYWRRKEALDQILNGGRRPPVEALLTNLATVVSTYSKDYHNNGAVLWKLYREYPQDFALLAEEANSILRGQEVGQWLGSHLQGFIAETLGKINPLPPQLLAILTELLKWPHWQVQMKAVEAIGRQRYPLPDEVLLRLYELRQNAYSPAVREAADDALTELLSLEMGIEDDH